tara:strand:- start:9 stop:197 length:189 start_codon:yes stop_codon:yes gene_type:complete
VLRGSLIWSHSEDHDLFDTDPVKCHSGVEIGGKMLKDHETHIQKQLTSREGLFHADDAERVR